MTKQLYTVARRDGEGAEYNLTLEDAAHRIMTYDGSEYEIRPRKDGEGFDLWARQQVANIPWRRTHWFSLAEDGGEAWLELAQEVIKDSQKDNWRGLVAYKQNTVTLNGKPVDFDAAGAMMDDELREELHLRLAPCSAQEFMDAYVIAHAEKFDGEQFTAN